MTLYTNDTGSISNHDTKVFSPDSIYQKWNLQSLVLCDYSSKKSIVSDQITRSGLIHLVSYISVHRPVKEEQLL